METTELQSAVLSSLEDSKAKDIINLDVRQLTDITDYMIICSGTSNRHLHSIADSILRHLKRLGVKPLGIEGEKTNEWILVDFGDIVIHVMMPQVREFYSLEKLWTTTHLSRQSNED